MALFRLLTKRSADSLTKLTNIEIYAAHFSTHFAVTKLCIMFLIYSVFNITYVY